MKKTTLGLSLALASALFSSSAFAVNVIVHPSNDSNLDQSTISRIFLGKAKAFPNGTSVVPFDQAEGAPATAEFNDKVLSRSGSQLKAYWSKLVFTGKGTPPEKLSGDAAVIEKVASTPGAIGYISGDASGNVKVVATF